LEHPDADDGAPDVMCWFGVSMWIWGWVLACELRGLRSSRASGRLEQAATDHPTLRKVWVDGGYRKHIVEHAAALGIDLEIIQRTPGARGFTPIPKRWTVERTYGWLILHRRPARDCETHPQRSEAISKATKLGSLTPP
jgi:transposase